MNSKADSCHQKNIFVRDAFLAVTGQNGVRRDRATGDGRKHHTSSKRTLGQRAEDSDFCAA
ncbi:MAG: hypothetical protein DMG39_28045 [Acidobacteria bacterium]|nr:MAG: hypothetical protein DMG39_28045 [Acidobacteriota bacterium]